MVSTSMPIHTTRYPEHSVSQWSLRRFEAETVTTTGWSVVCLMKKELMEKN